MVPYVDKKVALKKKLLKQKTEKGRTWLKIGRHAMNFRKDFEFLVQKIVGVPEKSLLHSIMTFGYPSVHSSCVSNTFFSDGRFRSVKGRTSMKICQSTDLELLCISAHVSPCIAQLNFDKNRFSNICVVKKTCFVFKKTSFERCQTMRIDS